MTEHDPVRIRLRDGSVYTLAGEQRLRAFHQKYGREDLDAVLDAFRDAVAEHWENRTKPWKGIPVEWGTDPYATPDESFEDHASLAEEVMYSAIRAPLMAIAMQAMAEEDGQSDAPSVLGLRDDDVVEYTGDEAIAHSSLDDVLGTGGED